MVEAILDITVAYILLCKLYYGYHNQAGFHLYLQNGAFFSRKICHVFWEKYELSCGIKISKSLKKVVKKGLGFFKKNSIMSEASVDKLNQRIKI